MYLVNVCRLLKGEDRIGLKGREKAKRTQRLLPLLYHGVTPYVAGDIDRKMVLQEPVDLGGVCEGEELKTYRIRF